ncbi:MAG: hypothetical protein JXJ17_18535 [Anaerolineae bacterium]|nr:hypothetical protein [Anaerolineae bacterium]
MNIDGDLIAIDLQTLPDFAMKKLEADGSWSDYSTTIPTDYVIPLNNKELEIGLQDIVYDGNSILDNPEGFTIVVYYINGRMHIYSRDEQALYICDWEYDDPAPIDLDACEKHEMNYEDNQFPYSFGYYEGQLLFNLNRGDRYRYKDGVIRQLHDDKGWGAQIYAMLNGQGLIYAGHFPSGEVRIYDGGVDYREMTPNISVPTGLPKTWREVQTLQLYAGYMYAGVWPYAELHQYSFNDDSWELVQRVFSHPRYPRICGVEPYSCRLYPLYSATGDYNIFGERINEMELVDEYLYIARSNKDGAAYDESWGFLTEEKLAEYGSVVRYKKDYNLACQFNWPDDGDTTIRVTLDDSGLTVYQDSVELCSLSVDLEGIGIDDSTLKLGDGIFGAYGGDGLTLVD